MNDGSPHRIYLDNAATSWPKPPAVYQAVDDYQRRLGAAAGRSTYAEAEDVNRQLGQLRQQILHLLQADPQQYVAVFTYSGTDSLCTALHGLLRPGDHVITTQAEHNSVLRPLQFLSEHGAVQVTRVPVDRSGWADPQDIQAALRPATRLIVLLHASNVTGIVQSLDDISQLARQHGAVLVVDAAQTLGRLPLDLAQLQADVVASPGHKGLLGPLGTGVLVLKRAVAEGMLSFRQGGTGSRSESDRQPDELPDRFEAGNLNVPGLLGLKAGLEFIMQQGLGRIAEHERQLSAALERQLEDLPGLQMYGTRTSRPRVGMVSLRIRGYDPQELATVLDANARIQGRAGYHCAPLIHRALGTIEQGGTLRLSLGPFNTFEELQVVADTLRMLASSQVGTS